MLLPCAFYACFRFNPMIFCCCWSFFFLLIPKQAMVWFGGRTSRMHCREIVCTIFDWIKNEIVGNAQMTSHIQIHTTHNCIWVLRLYYILSYKYCKTTYMNRRTRVPCQRQLIVLIGRNNMGNVCSV